MAVYILHKKSEFADAVPTIAELTAGEFGVNAADGDVFFRILVDPTGADSPENHRILSVRRPKYADGGVVTGSYCGESAQFFDLITATGEMFVDANGNELGFCRQL